MQLLRNLPGLLFGLLFAGGGLFFLYQTAWPTWHSWTAMRSWQPLQAQLLHVAGADNETLARYRYSVDGKTYENDRVYVASMKDNIGSYHADMQSKLRAEQQAGGAILIWVDTQNPRRTVIDRDMRWGFFALITGFCSIFVFIGGLVVYFSLRPGREQRTVEPPSLASLRSEWKDRRQQPGFKEGFIEFSQSRLAELSEQPGQNGSAVGWRSRKGWETAHIVSEAKPGLLKMWLFAAIWNLVSLPLLFVLAEEWAQGNYLILLGLIFPLVGAVLLYKAILQALEYRHFGKVIFEMDPYPGAIGGNVGGRVHLGNWPASRGMEAEIQVRVRLECVYSYISGSGKNRSRRENIKWAEEGEPRAERTGTGLSLLFRFHVPDNLPEADGDQSGAYHFWRLSVKAARRGVDLDRKYNIPVIHTGESSRYVDHDISDQVAKKKDLESKAIREAVAAGNFDLPGYSRAMRLTDLGGELRLVFPMFRNKMLTIFAAIFAGGFGFASYSMLRELAGDGFFGILMGFFSIPFVLVALVAAVATVYLPLNNLRVLCAFVVKSF